MRKAVRGRVTYDRAGKATYFLGDREVPVGEFRKALGVKPFAPDPHGCVPGGTPTTGWPIRSEALAVHSSQVDEANARARRHGINVHYEADGTCVIPDRGNRKKLLKLEGFHDNSGGYGD